MGLGIAMTAGVRARLGWRSGIMRSAISAEEARRTQALDSGTQTSGAVPCDLGSQSVPRACAMTAESLAATSTEAHLPCTDGPLGSHRCPSCRLFFLHVWTVEAGARAGRHPKVACEWNLAVVSSQAALRGLMALRAGVGAG